MSRLTEISSLVATLSGMTPFLGKMPATPDLCVVIYETGGLAPDLGLGYAGIRFETPAFQIVVRGVVEDYTTPQGIAETIYRGLPTYQAVTISGTPWHWIKPRQSPFLLTRDENKRVLIACNYLAERDIGEITP